MVAYITYSQFVRDVAEFAKSVPWGIVRELKAVVGIPRSGLIPATILAQHWGVPLADHKGILQWGTRGVRSEGQLWFVVDDSIYRGTAMNGFVDGSVFAGSAIRGAVYSHPESPAIDYIGPVLSSPRYFEWNLFGHPDTERFAFDLDGIMCLDPVVPDDDGPEYQQALIQAVPWRLPQRKVKAIVTMRLERWRCLTEAWLRKHRVQWDNLIMCPAATATQRRSEFDYGKWKGECAQTLGCELFVESCPRQSLQIHRTSGLPVICPTNGKAFS